jgi:hypothetical protein
MELFEKKIVAKRLNITVAVMMAEDIISFCLATMCPACRDEHWQMLEAHLASMRSRAEQLYRTSYPDKPPICGKLH